MKVATTYKAIGDNTLPSASERINKKSYKSSILLTNC